MSESLVGRRIRFKSTSTYSMGVWCTAVITKQWRTNDSKYAIDAVVDYSPKHSISHISGPWDYELIPLRYKLK